MRKIILLPLVVLLMDIPVVLYAQECRNLNDSEQRVLATFKTVLDTVITRHLEDANWKANEDRFPQNTTVAIHPLPARPLMFCQSIFRLTMQLQPGTAAYQTLADSAAYYMTLSSGATGNAMLAAIKKSAAFTEAMQHHITATENVPNYYLQEPGSAKIVRQYKNIAVAGAAMAFQVWYQPADPADADIQETVLCFGKWNTTLIKNNTGRWYYPFVFVHGNGTACIENIVVVIKTDATTALGIINAINWQGVNLALSR